jgi:hypothetical protein
MASREYMTESLGYSWDQAVVPRDIPSFSVERAVWRFQRSLPEYVWDAAVLEGNPFTYPEVQTLLDGITVGGRKISDERQILNLAEAASELLRMVKSGEFRLGKEVSDRLHLLIARDEALESGRFRGEGAGDRVLLVRSASAVLLRREHAHVAVHDERAPHVPWV